jgi:hypothetical protein
MDRAQIDSLHVIPRLLAGQLTAAEEAAFDEFAARNPEIYREVEQALRFKEGLKVLRDQGKLDYLLRSRPRRLRVPVAAAASVLLLACGALLWTRFHAAPPRAPSATITAFVPRGSKQTPFLGTYILTHARNATRSVDLELPARRGIVQLRLLPSNPHGSDSLNARLSRVTAEGDTHLIGEAAGLTASSADLYVNVYIDLSNLPQGDYEIALDTHHTHSLQERFTLSMP